MTPIAAGGTLLWTIALVLAWSFREELAESGREWWVACALCGVGLGVIGTAAMAVMDRRRLARHNGGDRASGTRNDRT